MRDGEPNMYGGIATLLNGHETGLRTYATAFLTFNVIAFSTVYGSRETETVKVVISMVGVFAHMGLLLLAAREIRWIRSLRRTLARLEGLDADTDASIRTTLFADPSVVNVSSRVNQLAIAIPAIGVVFIFFWFYQMVSHYVLLARSISL